MTTAAQRHTSAEAVTESRADFDRLRRTIADVLGVEAEEISELSSPDTLASWDSLNHLNVVMAIEAEFDVSLTPDDTLAMSDVRQMCVLLRTHGIEV